MRNRIWLLLICFPCLAVSVTAQYPAKRQLILQLSSGAFVAFKSEASLTNNKPAAEDQSLASLIYSQALTGPNHIIHRVLTDSDRRVIFGYDLWINPDPVSKKFSLGVLPADEAFRQTFLKESAQRAGESFVTFPRSTTPQTLDDGDAVSLELLVNEQSGVKIVDVVRVTFDRSILKEGSFEAVPKDFTLDAVSLSVKGYQLLMDGKLITKSKATVGCTGSLLWLYIPERGRFIFSLVPRDGYSFEKIGVLDGDKIEFVLDGERFEWLSAIPILPNGGTWKLWVLRDPSYTPLFSSDKPFTTPPGILQKLGQVVGVNRDTSFKSRSVIPVKPPFPQSGVKSQAVIPPRVMIGGADRMENLLPKSPSTPK